MSTPRFKKAPGYMGKDLTIHIGGGDKKITDQAILQGPQWARYVGMGFLVQLKDEVPAAVATAPIVAKPPAVVTAQAVSSEPSPVVSAPVPAPAPAQSVGTRSPANKIPDAALGGAGKPKGKPGPKAKTPEEKAADAKARADAKAAEKAAMETTVVATSMMEGSAEVEVTADASFGEASSPEAGETDKEVSSGDTDLPPPSTEPPVADSKDSTTES